MITEDREETDPRKIMEDLSNLTSNQCVCGHPVQAHYPLGNWMTGCRDDKCDCLEFEGV